MSLLSKDGHSNLSSLANGRRLEMPINLLTLDIREKNGLREFVNLIDPSAQDLVTFVGLLQRREAKEAIRQSKGEPNNFCYWPCEGGSI
jgi:hypothetical protein